MKRWNLKMCLSAVFVWFSCAGLFAQYHIKGEVYTGEDFPLYSGNVLAYDAQDSTFITGGIIAEGLFDLFPITQERVILKIRSLETEDFYQDISNPEGLEMVDLGKIVLKGSNTLKTVEVVEYIPLFEVDGTTTNVNVDGTLLGESLDPMEILERSPGVTVKDGAISVVGRGNTIIYADGQQITVDQFDMIPVDQIVRVEIIKDPSAKYGSDAGAVINVITKNYHHEGIQVNLRQAVLTPTLISVSSIGLNFERKKWLLNASYSSTFGNTWSTRLNNTEREGSYRSSLEALEDIRIQKHRGSLGVSYKIDSTSTATLEYQGAFSGIGVDITSENTISANERTTYTAFNEGEIGIRNHSLIGNYRKQLDTLGSTFFVGGQYASYHLSVDEDISEDIRIDGSAAINKERKITSNNWIHLLSGQLDYQKMLNESSSISLGMRYSNGINKGDLRMNNRVGDEYVLVSNYSSNTLFDEELMATYGEFETKIKGFDLRAGLRFERTVAEGLTTQESQVSLNREYNWLIPSLLISKRINKFIGANLSYNVSTGRPSYNDLDPKVFYIDSLTSKQGNPLLLPQIDHSVKFALNIGPMQLDATYYRSVNAFKEIVKEGLGGENSIVLFKENVNADRFYASATIPFQNKFLTTYLNYSVNFDKVRGTFGDFSEIDLKPYHYLYSYTQLRIKNVVNVEMIGSYTSGRFDGIYDDLNTYSISVGVSRSFLKDQLKCSILANDILFSERDAGSYYIGDYSVSYSSKNYSRFVRFSLNYSFGRLKQKNYESIDVGRDEKKRVN